MSRNRFMDQNDKWVPFFSPLLSSLSEAVYSRLEWELGWRAKTATRDSDLSDGWSKRSFWKQLKTCQQLQGRDMHVYITFLPQQVQSHHPFVIAFFFPHLYLIFYPLPLFIFSPLFALLSASFYALPTDSSHISSPPPALLLLLTLESALITQMTALRARRTVRPKCDTVKHLKTPGIWNTSLL